MSVVIKKEHSYSWSTCVACMCSLAQDSSDTIWPDKVTELLGRDGASITR